MGRNTNRVDPHWIYLRKHIHTSDYSPSVVNEWRCVHGVRLGFVDGGFSLCLSLVPIEKTKGGNILSPLPFARDIMKGYLLKQVQSFERNVQSLGPSSKARPTFQKNTLSNLTKMSICPDQAFILQLLDMVIKDLSPPDGVRVMLTLMRFGKKDSSPFVNWWLGQHGRDIFRLCTCCHVYPLQSRSCSLDVGSLGVWASDWRFW